MSEPRKAKARVAAHDATVVVENNVAALEAALAEAREAQRTQAYVDAVAAAHEKVERTERDLAGAKDALANAEAELDQEMSRVGEVAARKAAIAALPEDEQAAAVAAFDEKDKADREAWRVAHAAEVARAKASRRD